MKSCQRKKERIERGSWTLCYCNDLPPSLRDTLSAKLPPEDVLRTSRKTSRRPQDVPYGPICNAKGRILSGTSLRRTQDVNLTIIYKMDIILLFLIATAYQTMHCQSKLKIWFLLFWYYYGLRHFELNRTIKGRPQDVSCRLGSTITVCPHL